MRLVEEEAEDWERQGDSLGRGLKALRCCSSRCAAMLLAGWRCYVLCQARASSPGTAQAKWHRQVPCLCLVCL